MVNKNDILAFIKNPSSITELDIIELEKLQEAHPYFATLNLLLAKGHHTFESLNYHAQLKKTAISIPDREVLYKLIYQEIVQEEIKAIENNSQNINNDKKESVSEVENTTIDIKSDEQKIQSLEDIAGARKDEQDKLEDLILTHAIASASYNIDDLADIKEQDKLPETSSKNDNKEEHPSLPDSFYNWLTPNNIPEQERKPSIDELVEQFIKDNKNEKLAKKEFFSPTNIAKISVVDQNSFVTETLANIYFQQKKYDKALDAYEKLILRIPEKKPYFVDQIDKIKTILNT